jgi:hypothetical protein
MTQYLQIDVHIGVYARVTQVTQRPYNGVHTRVRARACARLCLSSINPYTSDNGGCVICVTRFTRPVYIAADKKFHIVKKSRDLAPAVVTGDQRIRANSRQCV